MALVEEGWREKKNQNTSTLVSVHPSSSGVCVFVHGAGLFGSRGIRKSDKNQVISD